MPLTDFGKICRKHRIRMKVVMADQSAATGFRPALISAVEQGKVEVPEGYVGKLIEWMQLDAAEVDELQRLVGSKLEREKEKGSRASSDRGGEGLFRILSQSTNKKLDEINGSSDGQR